MRAGCPESVERFSLYQAEWVLYSKQVIARLSLEMRNPAKRFLDIYRLAAQARTTFAERHKATLPRWEYYGKFRVDGSFEVFWDNTLIEQPWKMQWPFIFEKVKPYLKLPDGMHRLENVDIKTICCYSRDRFPLDSDEYKHCLPEVTSPVRAISILSPRSTRVESRTSLATIYYWLRPTHVFATGEPAIPQANTIRIEYAKPPFAGDYEIANVYYQHCLQWQPSQGQRELLIRIGRLSHLLAHLMPVKLGNSAITGWIQRAIALNKVIELGDYSQQFDATYIASWDFVALVTPDREEYAHWFADTAFEQI